MFGPDCAPITFGIDSDPVAQPIAGTSTQSRSASARNWRVFIVASYRDRREIPLADHLILKGDHL